MPVSLRQARSVLGDARSLTQPLVTALADAGLLRSPNDNSQPLTDVRVLRDRIDPGQVQRLAELPVLAAPHPGFLTLRVEPAHEPSDRDDWPTGTRAYRGYWHGAATKDLRDGWRGWWQLTAALGEPGNLDGSTVAASLSGLIVDVGQVKGHKIEEDKEDKGLYVILDIEDEPDAAVRSALHWHWLGQNRWPGRARWYPTDGWAGEDGGAEAIEEMRDHLDRVALLGNALAEQGLDLDEIADRVGLSKATLRSLIGQDG